MTESAKIIIHVDGGVVQNVFIPQGMKADVVLLDHDTEGCDPKDLTDGIFIARVQTTPHQYLDEEIKESLRKFAREVDLEWEI